MGLYDVTENMPWLRKRELGGCALPIGMPKQTVSMSNREIAKPESHLKIKKIIKY